MLFPLCARRADGVFLCALRLACLVPLRCSVGSQVLALLFSLSMLCLVEPLGSLRCRAVPFCLLVRVFRLAVYAVAWPRPQVLNDVDRYLCGLCEVLSAR